MFSVSLTRESQDPSRTVAEKVQRLTLLPDVKKLQWRYLDSRSGSWSEEWKDQSFRPSLIELTLSLPGEEDQKTLFWLPPVTRINPVTAGERPDQGGEPRSNQPPAENPKGKPQQGRPSERRDP
jgi:hypothetical protein